MRGGLYHQAEPSTRLFKSDYTESVSDYETESTDGRVGTYRCVVRITPY